MLGHQSLIALSAIYFLLFCFLKGPPGKDGLPGHPGQRGEVVSNYLIIIIIIIIAIDHTVGF